MQQGKGQDVERVKFGRFPSYSMLQINKSTPKRLPESVSFLSIRMVLFVGFATDSEDVEMGSVAPYL